MAGYDELLADVFAGREPDITEENLQARIRGNLLMALSNKFGWLVLTTGNKSEMSVGYSTLYGDSAGGFAVIKDVPEDARLPAGRRARRAATRESPVPESIVTRAPSAELRPDQRDEDSLPPYEVLDAILEGYVEQDLGREQLIARGLPEADVDRVIRLVDLAEYKRRQNPPGIKVTSQGVRARPADADRQPLRRMIALVTGAGNPRGIGAACVRALAERGATVAFTVHARRDGRRRPARHRRSPPTSPRRSRPSG